MVPSLGRLKRRPDFLKVARSGRKWVTPGLILQIASRRPAGAGSAVPDVARVGFTVSRKVGNAVARNRARRRLKAAAEEVLRLAAEAGCDYVIIGRAATLRRRWPDLKADLETAVQGLSRGRTRDRRQDKPHQDNRHPQDRPQERAGSGSGREREGRDGPQC